MLPPFDRLLPHYPALDAIPPAPRDRVQQTQSPLFHVARQHSVSRGHTPPGLSAVAEWGDPRSPRLRARPSDRALPCVRRRKPRDLDEWRHRPPTARRPWSCSLRLRTPGAVAGRLRAVAPRRAFSAVRTRPRAHRAARRSGLARPGRGQSATPVTDRLQPPALSDDIRRSVAITGRRLP
jgi:hypothetical protein